MIIKITDDMVDQIVVTQLLTTRDYLSRDLSNIEAGNFPRIFDSSDPERDKEQIQEHIDAVNLLLRWYATPDQIEEILNDQ
jgi:hypothetical protein